MSGLKCPSNSGKPKQYTGCPNGMDCTFLHKHNIEGCVDENHNSTEDIFFDWHKKFLRTNYENSHSYKVFKPVHHVLKKMFS